MTRRKKPAVPDFHGDKDLEREYWEEIRKQRRRGVTIAAREKKDSLIAAILKHEPQLTTRELAHRVGKRESTVREARLRLEALERVEKYIPRWSRQSRREETNEKLAGYINKNPGASNEEIAAAFGLTPATVRKYKQRLYEEGFLLHNEATRERLRQLDERLRRPPDNLAEPDGWVREIWKRNDAAGLQLEPGVYERYIKILRYKLRAENWTEDNYKEEQ